MFRKPPLLQPAPLPRAIVLAALATLPLLSACHRSEEKPPPEIRPVRAVTIEKRAAGETVALTGSMQAQTEINLAFRIDGRMLERLVSIGDTVRPGQLVARLDSQNEESSLQAARAQLAAARAQLTEARNNFVRFRDLVAEKAVSQASFEQAESMQKSAESQVESAQTQVRWRKTGSLHAARLRRGRRRDGEGAEPGEVVGAAA